MKIFRKKESDEDIYKRLLKLNSLPKECIPGIDAQTALNELCTHLLGEDYYIVDPLCNTQCNFIIVQDIERKYRKFKKKGKHFKNS